MAKQKASNNDVKLGVVGKKSNEKNDVVKSSVGRVTFQVKGITPPEKEPIIRIKKNVDKAPKKEVVIHNNTESGRRFTAVQANTDSKIIRQLIVASLSEQNSTKQPKADNKIELKPDYKKVRAATLKRENEQMKSQVKKVESWKNKMDENEADLFHNHTVKTNIIFYAIDNGFDAAVKKYSNEENSEFLKKLKGLSKNKLFSKVQELRKNLKGELKAHLEL